jgi:D-proline reductase (dithiol) PrdB
MARVFEESGLPTVSMSSALDITSLVKPPRAVFVNFPLGHQCGKADDPAGQRAILKEALRLLETAREGGTLLSLPVRWREDDPTDSWEEETFREPAEA